MSAISADWQPLIDGLISEFQDNQRIHRNDWHFEKAAALRVKIEDVENEIRELTAQLHDSRMCEPEFPKPLTEVPPTNSYEGKL